MTKLDHTVNTRAEPRRPLSALLSSGTAAPSSANAGGTPNAGAAMASPFDLLLEQQRAASLPRDDRRAAPPSASTITRDRAPVRRDSSAPGSERPVIGSRQGTTEPERPGGPKPPVDRTDRSPRAGRAAEDERRSDEDADVTDAAPDPKASSNEGPERVDDHTTDAQATSAANASLLVAANDATPLATIDLATTETDQEATSDAGMAAETEPVGLDLDIAGQGADGIDGEASPVDGEARVANDLGSSGDPETISTLDGPVGGPIEPATSEQADPASADLETLSAGEDRFGEALGSRPVERSAHDQSTAEPSSEEALGLDQTTQDRAPALVGSDDDGSVIDTATEQAGALTSPDRADTSAAGDEVNVEAEAGGATPLDTEMEEGSADQRPSDGETPATSSSTTPDPVDTSDGQHFADTAAGPVAVDAAPVDERVRTVAPAAAPDGARVDGATGVQQRAPEAAAAAAPISTPQAAEFDGEVWEQVQKAVGLVRQNGPGRHEVSLVLRPDELGSVAIELTQRGDDVAVRIITQTAAAQDRLDRGRLLAELQAAGIDPSAVDISHHDANDSGRGSGEGEADGPPKQASPGVGADNASGQRPIRRSPGLASSTGGGLDLAL